MHVTVHGILDYVLPRNIGLGGRTYLHRHSVLHLTLNDGVAEINF